MSDRKDLFDAPLRPQQDDDESDSHVVPAPSADVVQTGAPAPASGDNAPAVPKPPIPPQQVLFDEPEDEVRDDEPVTAPNLEEESPEESPVEVEGFLFESEPPATEATAHPEDFGADSTDESEIEPEAEEIADPTAVPILSRLTSGLLDLAALLAVGLIALVIADLVGVSVGFRVLPALALFLLPFSFLYHVISLLFWGRTPGMASVGLVARDLSGLPLSAQQAARRWLGSLATILLAGIPMVVSWFTGRSLADSLAESVTLVDIS